MNFKELVAEQQELYHQLASNFFENTIEGIIVVNKHGAKRTTYLFFECA
ncbi:MAG: hypothetical protein RBR54_02235 [Sulfurimonas sp.]|jgi:hypothetical protein|nr:hypothetical protein [Sulfurimonas sp.]